MVYRKTQALSTLQIWAVECKLMFFQSTRDRKKNIRGNTEADGFG